MKEDIVPERPDWLEKTVGGLQSACIAIIEHLQNNSDDPFEIPGITNEIMLTGRGSVVKGYTHQEKLDYLKGIISGLKNACTAIVEYLNENDGPFQIPNTTCEFQSTLTEKRFVIRGNTVQQKLDCLAGAVGSLKNTCAAILEYLKNNKMIILADRITELNKFLVSMNLPCYYRDGVVECESALLGSITGISEQSRN